jgi:hypothetical protein
MLRQVYRQECNTLIMKTKIRETKYESNQVLALCTLSQILLGFLSSTAAKLKQLTIYGCKCRATTWYFLVRSVIFHVYTE